MLISPSLNSSQLKLIACLFMLTDHIGVFLFPDIMLFRILGRLAFPIFAYFIAIGALHTSSAFRYLLRLGIFSLLFQWFYAKAFETEQWNIFFTLFVGLLAILITKYFYNQKRVVIGLFLSAAIIYLGTQIDIDYGWYGVCLVYFSFLFINRKALLILSWFILNILYALPYFPEVTVQIFSLLSLPLVLSYNGERGTVSKWFFYGFYILHILVLWWLKLMLN